MHRQGQGQTGRLAGRQPDRQAGWQADTVRDGQAYIHTHHAFGDMPPTPICDVQLSVLYSLSRFGCCTAYRYWGVLLPIAVVDVVVGVDASYGVAGLTFEVTPPAAENLTVTLLENPLFVDPATLDAILPALVGLAVPTIAESLGREISTADEARQILGIAPRDGAAMVAAK